MGFPTSSTGFAGSPGLALSATSVVVTVSNGIAPATLVSVPKAGGPSRVVATASSNLILSIAVAGQDAYFTTFGAGAPPLADLCHVALSGGAVDVVASAQFRPNGIAVDADSVYWTIGNTADSPPTNDGIVRRIARAGGPVQELAFGQKGPWAIAVDANNVYFTNLATDSSSTDGNIAAVPIVGGSVRQVVSNVGDAWALAVDTNDVYFTDDGDGNSLDAGSLNAVPLGGGSDQVLTANGYSQAGAVAIDANHVYFFAGSSFGSYGLMVRSKSANVTRALQADDLEINSSGNVATDPTCVYWTSATTLWKAPLAP
jgi:hypothetical protein